MSPLLSRRTHQTVGGATPSTLHSRPCSWFSSSSSIQSPALIFCPFYFNFPPVCSPQLFVHPKAPTLSPLCSAPALVIGYNGTSCHCNLEALSTALLYPASFNCCCLVTVAVPLCSQRVVTPSSMGRDSEGWCSNHHNYQRRCQKMKKDPIPTRINKTSDKWKDKLDAMSQSSNRHGHSRV